MRGKRVYLVRTHSDTDTKVSQSAARRKEYPTNQQLVRIGNTKLVPDVEEAYKRRYRRSGRV